MAAAQKASKILWLLTKYLIKQKYVAAKSTQKSNLQRARERKNIFCILTHAGRAAHVKLTTHTHAHTNTLGMHVNKQLPRENFDKGSKNCKSGK